MTSVDLLSPDESACAQKAEHPQARQARSHPRTSLDYSLFRKRTSTRGAAALRSPSYHGAMPLAIVATLWCHETCSVSAVNGVPY